MLCIVLCGPLQHIQEGLKGVGSTGPGTTAVPGRSVSHCSGFKTQSCLFCALRGEVCSQHRLLSPSSGGAAGGAGHRGILACGWGQQRCAGSTGSVLSTACTSVLQPTDEPSRAAGGLHGRSCCWALEEF